MHWSVKGLSQIELLLNRDILKECCGVFGSVIIFSVLPTVIFKKKKKETTLNVIRKLQTVRHLHAAKVQKTVKA